MYLGPGSDGTPLEVVAVRRPDGALLVIHAMRLRPKLVELYRSGDRLQ